MVSVPVRFSVNCYPKKNITVMTNDWIGIHFLCVKLKSVHDGMIGINLKIVIIQKSTVSTASISLTIYGVLDTRTGIRECNA